MSDFKTYQPVPSSPSKLNVSFNKVVRPIVFSNLPGFKISDETSIYVSYNFNFSTVIFSTIDAQIYLEISSDNSAWTTLGQNILSTQTGPSQVSLGLATLTGFIPKGYFVRLRGQVDLNSSITFLDGTEYILTLE